MDLFCPVCSEPMDVLSLHDFVGDSAEDFQDAKNIFFSSGCGTLFGKPCVENRTLRSEATLALEELMGDDVDGIASMLEDLEYEGLL